MFQGSNLGSEDVEVRVGGVKCHLIHKTNQSLRCLPPSAPPIQRDVMTYNNFKINYNQKIIFDKKLSRKNINKFEMENEELAWAYQVGGGGREEENYDRKDEDEEEEDGYIYGSDNIYGTTNERDYVAGTNNGDKKDISGKYSDINKDAVNGKNKGNNNKDGNSNNNNGNRDNKSKNKKNKDKVAGRENRSESNNKDIKRPQEDAARDNNNSSNYLMVERAWSDDVRRDGDDYDGDRGSYEEEKRDVERLARIIVRIVCMRDVVLLFIYPPSQVRIDNLIFHVGYLKYKPPPNMASNEFLIGVMTSLLGVALLVGMVVGVVRRRGRKDKFKKLDLKLDVLDKPALRGQS